MYYIIYLLLSDRDMKTRNLLYKKITTFINQNLTATLLQQYICLCTYKTLIFEFGGSE